MSAISFLPLRAREIRLGAAVTFALAGVMLRGRVTGISRDCPMRYDLVLEGGQRVPNVPETDIGAVINPEETARCA